MGEVKEQEQHMYIKATLRTGKTVVLRQPEIEDQENAMMIAGTVAGNNQLQQGMIAQREMLKSLIVGIDGEKLNGTQKESLKSLFTFHEWMEMNKVMEEMIGNPTKPKLETVSSFGEKLPG